MEDQKKRLSIFSPYSSADPSMNVPVTAGPAGAIMSPYLNFDPAYINPNQTADKAVIDKRFSQFNEPQTTKAANMLAGLGSVFRCNQLKNSDSQFIFPEGASRQRGRLELSFSHIGGSTFVGAAVGGLNGLYTGLRETSSNQLTGAVRRTQMLNYITKQGASTAQTLGVVALMYSIFGVILSTSRGVDDELNTVTAGTATGLLYKCSAGWQKCLRGGAIGFTLASAYVLLTSQRLKDLRQK